MSAFDDFRPHGLTLQQWADHRRMLDEIDRLRDAVKAFRRLCGCESDCEFDGTEIVHRPCCFRWEP